MHGCSCPRSEKLGDDRPDRPDPYPSSMDVRPLSGRYRTGGCCAVAGTVMGRLPCSGVIPIPIPSPDVYGLYGAGSGISSALLLLLLRARGGERNGLSNPLSWLCWRLSGNRPTPRVLPSDPMDMRASLSLNPIMTDAWSAGHAPSAVCGVLPNAATPVVVVTAPVGARQTREGVLLFSSITG